MSDGSCYRPCYIEGCNGEVHLDIYLDEEGNVNSVSGMCGTCGQSYEGSDTDNFHIC